MLEFVDKVALVTACGSFGPGWGNGKATATLLARQGATVVGVDVDLAAAEITRSVVGLRFVGKDQVAYAAAKAGLLQFTKVTAVAFAEQNVRLNTVVPGLMDTPLVRRLADRYAKGDYGGMVAKRHAQVPMGHMGD